MIRVSWIAFSGKSITPHVPLVPGLHLAMGFAFALVNMNQIRLAMVIAPVLDYPEVFEAHHLSRTEA